MDAFFVVNEMWLSSWEEVINSLKNPFFLVDFVLATIIIILLIILAFKVFKSKKFALVFLALFISLGITLFFHLWITSVAICLIILLVTTLMTIVSSSEIRSVMHDDFKWNGTIATKKNTVEKEDWKNLCDILEKSVIEMSRKKCGALIILEVKDRITTDRFSRYSNLDCEVTEDIIQTIFYKGSPLHDGATIIREGRILRAGVILDSVSVSTAAIPGALGSRHRAALGITESCDCVSITVSEETGSIHLFHEGTIRKVYMSNFKEMLLELLPIE